MVLGNAAENRRSGRNPYFIYDNDSVNRKFSITNIEEKDFIHKEEEYLLLPNCW